MRHKLAELFHSASFVCSLFDNWQPIDRTLVSHWITNSVETELLSPFNRLQSLKIRFVFYLNLYKGNEAGIIQNTVNRIWAFYLVGTGCLGYLRRWLKIGSGGSFGKTFFSSS